MATEVEGLGEASGDQDARPQTEASDTAIKFPVPEFDGPTVVFGAPLSAYPTREQLGEFYGGYHPMNKVASALFFNGGRLADHGLQFRPGIDKGKAMNAIKAFLCSFEPKHEIKEATVGYALSQWCEPLTPTAPQDAQQDRREA